MTFSITFDLTKLAAGYTLGVGCVDGVTKAGQDPIVFGLVAGPVCRLDEVPVDPMCETAYASGGKCFLEFPELRSKNWGWSLGPLMPLGEEEQPLVYELVAGAGRCMVEAGEVVGLLEVEYRGSTVTVRYEVFAGNDLMEAHLYVGSTPLCMFRGAPTTAPGQYPYNDMDHAVERDNESAKFMIENVSGPIYVVAHSVVCYYPAE